MNAIPLEIRRVDPTERTVLGVCVPYDETSYLIGDQDGERVRRGAFRRSIQHRAAGIPLLLNHEQTRKFGKSRKFTETDEGLVGEFVINGGGPGDQLLEELRDGYLDAMSVGFQSVRTARGDGGVREIVEARLVEVSIVALPAYQGAKVLAVRSASVEELLAGFGPRPEVNLTPIPPISFP